MTELSAFVDNNARYSVVGWEPVPGSGERINVAALCEYDGRFIAKSLVREEVLRCMYGAAGDGVFQMVEGVIEALSAVARGHGLEAALASLPLSNFSIAEPRATWASNENDLLRQIVLMNCSLSVIADEPISTSDDLPTPEREVNQQWTTKVKEAIQVQPKPSGPETMTVQEVWEAAGGNPGIRATKQGVLDALKMLDAVCDEAQPAEQEPVAWCDQYESHIDGLRHYSDGGAREIPLYAAPQPRRRLTDEEIDNTTRKQVDCLLDHIYEYGTAAEGIDYRLRAIARAIERAHGIGEHE